MPFWVLVSGFVTVAGLLGAVFGALAASRIVERRYKDLVFRLEGVESRDVARQLAFDETQDQVYRHLKRVQAIRQHAKDGDSLTQALIARKFSQGA